MIPRSTLPDRSWWGFLFLGVFLFPGLPGETGNAATVRVKIIDGKSETVTPAMICITGEKGEVRLPPGGEIAGNPSRTPLYYQGIRFDPDPHWAGPVRKMQGQGDNDDRAWVYETRPSIPYWEEPVNYWVSGDFCIDLPPGKWRLAVDHGMEYIPCVVKFETRGEEEYPLEIRMEPWIDLPAKGWWSGDVHVHHPTTEPAFREFLMASARAADLHVMNILEMGHHGGLDFKQAGFGTAFRQRQGDYLLVSGQEDPRSTFGHIIGLNLQFMVRDLSTYDYYDLTFNRIHRQPGALVGFAHFAWNGCDLPRGFPWYVPTESLDFIELLQFGLLNWQDYYDYLNLGFRLTAAAGSDVPWGSSVGEVRTFVHTGPQLDADGWFEGLARGHTFVSNGPALELYVNGQLPGSEINLSKPKTLRVTAQATSHPAVGLLESLILVNHEGELAEIANDSGKSSLSTDFHHHFDQSQWIAARAECENGAIAHTTPVYVRVENRPTWSSRKGPPVIHKQLAAIAVIESEFEGKTDERSRGIRQRLAAARNFYQERLQEMSRSATP